MKEERRRWELTVDARQSSLGTVDDFMQEVSAVLDLDEDDAFAVQLATDEACQNAVRHACEFDPDKKVVLSCESVGSDLVIRVSERGKPFDPTEASGPNLDAPLAMRNGGGLGIHFMRNMMDEVRYDQGSDGVNSVTMVKRGVVGEGPAQQGPHHHVANPTEPSDLSSNETCRSEAASRSRGQ